MSALGAAVDRRLLDLAARAALRGAGCVEPNPMVGCVIGTEAGEVLGIGHHRRFGGPHAEIEAIRACREKGRSVRGATAWVTLEPCDHSGKTGPCSVALIEAGIARVVMARRDPNPLASGGMERLRAAGVRVEECGASALAVGVGAPFVKRVTSGLPWVIAKWAQTLDGMVATRSGDSKWISNETSRRGVHILRGRVDAVMTGIGTVLADDPMLTARGVRARRLAARVVVDSELRIPLESALVRSAREARVIVAAREEVVAREPGRLSALRGAGVEVVAAAGGAEGGVELRGLLARLWQELGIATVLVEAGPRLMGGLFEAGLVDEARVYVAPIVLGDGAARTAVAGEARQLIAQAAARMRLMRARRVGATDDVMMMYRRA